MKVEEDDRPNPQLKKTAQFGSIQQFGDTKKEPKNLDNRDAKKFRDFSFKDQDKDISKTEKTQQIKKNSPAISDLLDVPA